IRSAVRTAGPSDVPRAQAAAVGALAVEVAVALEAAATVAARAVAAVWVDHAGRARHSQRPVPGAASRPQFRSSRRKAGRSIVAIAFSRSALDAMVCLAGTPLTRARLDR